MKSPGSFCAVQHPAGLRVLLDLILLLFRFWLLKEPCQLLLVILCQAPTIILLVEVRIARPQQRGSGRPNHPFFRSPAIRGLTSRLQMGRAQPSSGIAAGPLLFMVSHADQKGSPTSLERPVLAPAGPST